jgi:hypothetical protein
MTEQSEYTPAPNRRSVVGSLLLAPAAFAVVAGFNYAVAPALCAGGLEDSGLFAGLAFVVTAAGILAGVWGGYTAYRLRQLGGEAGLPSDDSGRFLSVGGILLSVLFVALAIFAGLSSLAFRPCHPV